VICERMQHSASLAAIVWRVQLWADHQLTAARVEAGRRLASDELIEEFGMWQRTGIGIPRHEAETAIETNGPFRGLKGNQRIMTTPRDRQRRTEIGLSQTTANTSPLPDAADRKLLQMQIGTEDEVAAVADDRAVDLSDDHRRFVRQPINLLFIPRRRFGQ
jgi:hypothetical protein